MLEETTIENKLLTIASFLTLEIHDKKEIQDTLHQEKIKRKKAIQQIATLYQHETRFITLIEESTTYEKQLRKEKNELTHITQRYIQIILYLKENPSFENYKKLLAEQIQHTQKAIQLLHKNNPQKLVDNIIEQHIIHNTSEQSKLELLLYLLEIAKHIHTLQGLQQLSIYVEHIEQTYLTEVDENDQDEAFKRALKQFSTSKGIFSQEKTIYDLLNQRRKLQNTIL